MMGTSHAAPPLASSASGAYDSFMTRTILQALAWLALIGIAIATLSPIGLRPRLSMLPVDIERSAAFVVVGLLFALAYPRKIWLALLIVIIGVFGLEWLQELRPDRHGRFADAMVKSVGALIGLSAGWVLVRIAETVFPSLSSDTPRAR